MHAHIALSCIKWKDVVDSISAALVAAPESSESFKSEDMLPFGMLYAVPLTSKPNSEEAFEIQKDEERLLNENDCAISTSTDGRFLTGSAEDERLFPGCTAVIEAFIINYVVRRLRSYSIISATLQGDDKHLAMRALAYYIETHKTEYVADLYRVSLEHGGTTRFISHALEAFYFIEKDFNSLIYTNITAYLTHLINTGAIKIPTEACEEYANALDNSTDQPPAESAKPLQPKSQRLKNKKPKKSTKDKSNSTGKNRLLKELLDQNSPEYMIADGKEAIVNYIKEIHKDIYNQVEKIEKFKEADDAIVEQYFSNSLFLSSEEADVFRKQLAAATNTSSHSRFRRIEDIVYPPTQGTDGEQTGAPYAVCSFWATGWANMDISGIILLEREAFLNKADANMKMQGNVRKNYVKARHSTSEPQITAANPQKKLTATHINTLGDGVTRKGTAARLINSYWTRHLPIIEKAGTLAYNILADTPLSTKLELVSNLVITNSEFTPETRQENLLQLKVYQCMVGCYLIYTSMCEGITAQIRCLLPRDQVTGRVSDMRSTSTATRIETATVTNCINNIRELVSKVSNASNKQDNSKYEELLKELDKESATMEANQKQAMRPSRGQRTRCTAAKSQPRSFSVSSDEESRGTQLTSNEASNVATHTPSQPTEPEPLSDFDSDNPYRTYSYWQPFSKRPPRRATDRAPRDVAMLQTFCRLMNNPARVHFCTSVLRWQTPAALLQSLSPSHLHLICQTATQAAPRTVVTGGDGQVPRPLALPGDTPILPRLAWLCHLPVSVLNVLSSLDDLSRYCVVKYQDSISKCHVTLYFRARLDYPQSASPNKAGGISDSISKLAGTTEVGYSIDWRTGYTKVTHLRLASLRDRDEQLKALRENTPSVFTPSSVPLPDEREMCSVLEEAAVPATHVVTRSHMQWLLHQLKEVYGAETYEHISADALPSAFPLHRTCRYLKYPDGRYSISYFLNGIEERKLWIYPSDGIDLENEAEKAFASAMSHYVESYFTLRSQTNIRR